MKLTITILWISLGLSVLKAKKSSRIRGGRKINHIADAPWNVFIEVKTDSKVVRCSGSIIGRHHVLTAAS